MRATQPQFIRGIRRLVWVCSAFVLWHATTVWAEIPSYILPSPWVVIKTLFADKIILWNHAQDTLYQWSIGLTLSTIVGVALSWLAFEHLSFEKFLSRTLVVSQSVPYLTIAPLLLLWFGLGAAPKIILILLTCTFPITQLTLNGLRNAQLEYGILVAMMRLGKNKALKAIYIPAALPQFFEGVKIAVTYAFVSSVLAELIGSEAGLGVYLSRAQTAYRTDRVMAVVIVIVFFSLFCTWIVSKLAHKTQYWKVEKNV